MLLKKIIGIILILIGGYLCLSGLINGIAWINGRGSAYLGAALIGLIGAPIFGVGFFLFKKE